MGLPYEFLQSPHRRPRTKSVSALVMHYSGSLDLDLTAAWMCSAAAAGRSAHYLVGRSGRVIQLVLDEDVAFHAGRSAMYPNAANDAKEPHVDEFSIGVELLGTHDSGFIDKQLDSLYQLVEILIHAHKILPDRIVGHEHIAPGRQLDPSGYFQQFPWRVLREKAESAYNALQARRLRP